MEEESIIRIIITFVFAVLWMSIIFFAKKVIVNFGNKKGISHERQISLTRFSRAVTVILFIVSMSITWGVRFSSFWIYFTSTFAVIGMVLFSRFSFLSNIFSAFLIYFTLPFRLGDTITVYPTEKKRIKGVILEMNLFHIFLQDEAGDRVMLHNNVILERAIKRHQNSDPQTARKLNWQTMSNTAPPKVQLPGE